ncbi:MAG: DUF1186 domain-containing protein [Blastocatellia bacterium]
MTIEEILPHFQTLKHPFPSEAVREAIARQAEITPALLAALQEVAESPRAVLDRGDDTYLYACFLLAQFRETPAFPLLLRLASYPDPLLDELLGDAVTEYLSRLLASTYDGNLPALREFIENPAHDEWARAGGIRAMAILMAEGTLSRETLTQNLLELLEKDLGPEDYIQRSEIACLAADLGPAELYEPLRDAFRNQRMDSMIIGFDEIEEVRETDAAVLLREFRDDDHNQLIEDTIAEMEGWHSFQKKPQPAPPPARKPAIEWRSTTPATADTPKTGRNDPCPCGSGKKYKKCHG